MSQTLKPCPFCGGLAELDTMRAYWGPNTGMGDEVVVNCLSCGSMVAECYADHPGFPRQDVINATVSQWNKRAGD